jgi:hypothetical protein
MTTDNFVNMSLNPPFVASYGATYQLSDLPTFNLSNPLLGSSATGISASGTEPTIPDGYVQEWNLAIEQGFGPTAFSLSYVGNKGTHLVGGGFSNLANPGPGPIPPRRPFTNVNVGLAGSGADANYNALQARLERRFSAGLSFIVSYAFQHALSDSDGTYIESQSAVAQHPNNLHLEYSNAEFDVRNAVTFSYVYELPFGQGHALLGQVGSVTNKLINGWQVQGITQLYSGAHQAYVTLGYDNLNNGGTGYPDRICDPNFGHGRTNASKVAMFFNTACFAPPAGGKVGVPNYIFGNSSRHPLANPGINLWSIGAQKDTIISERLRVQFITEFLNAFNHPNFSIPNTSFGTPQFGRITVANDGRNIQFALKLIF